MPASEISEKSADYAARKFCRTIEDGLKWVLASVVEKRDMMVFGEIMAALWVVSVVGSWFDLITFAYLSELFLSYSCRTFLLISEVLSIIVIDTMISS